MTALKTANLALTFLPELAGLAPAAAYWGYQGAVFAILVVVNAALSAACRQRAS